MPSYEWFNVTQPAEYVTHVEINRADKLNAFKEPMWFELRSVFDALSTDPSVRVIVLTGAGDRAFTAGLDTKDAAEHGPLAAGPSDIDAARKAGVLRRHIRDFQDAITSIERCEKPVICILHGYSFGLAIDMSTACDVRICVQDTKFCVKEVDIGLAADVGTLTRLPKVVGSYGWVKDVSMSARIFGPEEALRVGLVNAVHKSKQEAISAAVTWASLVAEKSPVAVQGTKRILDYSRDHSVDDGLHYTAVWNSAMLQTNDTLLAMKSGWTKKKPTFEKL